MKELTLRSTSYFDPDRTTVMRLSKEDALDLIKDLMESIADVGTTREIFRFGEELYIFEVDK